MAIRSESGIFDGVRGVLRGEGLALFAVALALYSQTGASWSEFLLLVLAPDLAFLFYLAGPRSGAFAYNLTHSTIGPILLACIALFGTMGARAPLLLPLALIWLAHVGIDRALGYGLKYASGFADTHLGPIGNKRHKLA